MAHLQELTNEVVVFLCSRAQKSPPRFYHSHTHTQTQQFLDATDYTSTLQVTENLYKTNGPLTL
jgi:CMP-N-acetylneuraminic acid synthetase